MSGKKNPRKKKARQLRAPAPGSGGAITIKTDDGDSMISATRFGEWAAHHAQVPGGMAAHYSVTYVPHGLRLPAIHLLEASAAGDSMSMADYDDMVTAGAALMIARELSRLDISIPVPGKIDVVPRAAVTAALVRVYERRRAARALLAGEDVES